MFCGELRVEGSINIIRNPVNVHMGVTWQSVKRSKIPSVTEFIFSLDSHRDLLFLHLLLSLFVHETHNQGKSHPPPPPPVAESAWSRAARHRCAWVRTSLTAQCDGSNLPFSLYPASVFFSSSTSLTPNRIHRVSDRRWKNNRVINVRRDTIGSYRRKIRLDSFHRYRFDSNASVTRRAMLFNFIAPLTEALTIDLQFGQIILILNCC